MQNYTDNQEHDAFSKGIREKLEEHRMPVDADCWAEIEARLNTKKKKKVIPFWFWLTSGAAVAFATLLFTLQPISESTFYAKKDGQKNIQKEVSNTKTLVNQQYAQTNKIKTRAQIKASYKTETAEKSVAQISATQEKATSYNSTAENTNNNNPKINQNFAQSQTIHENKDSVFANKATRYIPENLTERQDKQPASKHKSKQNWLLAAAFGSGGSQNPGYSAGNEYASDPKNFLVTSALSNSSSPGTDDFSNKNYQAPVSFGLIVRKNLNKTLSIETGLVYTYLLSTFENSGSLQSDAKLKLHYLGVPISLIAKVWNNSKWEAYLSGGGMLDKGLRSIYIRNQYYGNQTITTKTTTEINGMQWSLNGGVGITYKLQQNIGVYFEPKISYYFDNNQPISIRTNQPLALGLTAGFRLEIK